VADAWFEGAVEDWIHRFKYPRPGLAGLDPAARALARELALRSARRVPRRRAEPPDLVAPVPLHPRRLRERGFNPAALLARAAARALGAPLGFDVLARVRDTPSQTGLARTARLRNLRGAFRAGRVPAGARVWLVDDVVTTGATIAEAAACLRRAGAASVVGVCAARTPTRAERAPTRAGRAATTEPGPARSPRSPRAPGGAAPGPRAS